MLEGFSALSVYMLVKNKKSVVVMTLLMLTFVFGSFFVPEIAYAQDAATGILEGTEIVGEATGLGNEDPRVIIARIIRVFLGFLGVIAVSIVIYGGFLYMTSGGSEQGVEKAKKWIVNGIIGLIIILTSFALTSFIINALADATGTTLVSSTDTGGSLPGGGGTGIVSGFKVGVSPQGGNKPITSSVKVTFPIDKDPLATDGFANASDNLSVVSLSTDADGNSVSEDVPGTVTVEGKKITFTPDQECPPGCSKTNCFAANTDFEILVNRLESQDNDLVQCPNQLLGYCAKYDFSTNDVCDDASPTLSFHTPVTPVMQDGFADFETEASDIGGVAEVAFCENNTDDLETCQSVVPGGDTSPTLFPYVFAGDMLGAELGWHTALGIATDVSDNSRQVNKDYLVASDACFNTDGQFDCELVECELDCDGSCLDLNSCQYFCEEVDGVTICGPWPYPIVTSVSPVEAPNGSFITINGKNFGDFGTNSGITINGVPVGLACAPGQSWFNNQVVVVAPDNALSGPVKLTSNNDVNEDGTPDFYDSSDPNAKGFTGDVSIVVNDDAEWIGLCSVLEQTSDKANGQVGQFVTAQGQKFGNEGSLDAVYFGGLPSSFTGNWSDTSINDIRIPNVKYGNTKVQVGKDQLYSNAVNFYVDVSEVEITIADINPNPAPPEQYVTITGTNFGNGGSVTFINNDTGVEFSGIIGCQSGWSDSQINVQIPADATPSTNYTVQVSTGQGSVTSDFEVDANLEVAPGICQITPDNGPAGTPVTFIGSGFGSQPGSVTFSDNEVVGAGTLTTIATWTETEISGVLVPATANSGPVKVTNNGGLSSNSVDFNFGKCEVGSCGEGNTCCQNSFCTEVSMCEVQATNAEYGWFFSTGQIPKVPKIIERSCVKGDYNQSPSPRRFEENACPNGNVDFAFNLPMDENSFFDKVEVRRCSETGAECNLDVCDSTNCIKGFYTFEPNAEVEYKEIYKTEYNNELVTEINLRNLDLEEDHWYQIVVHSGVAAEPDLANETGAIMPNDYTWRFKTGVENCAIDAIVVNPSHGLIEEVYEEQKYSLNGQALNCDKLDVSEFPWIWNVEKWDDRLELRPKADSSNDIAYFGVRSDSATPETPFGDPGIVSASAEIEGIPFSDTATLAVKFRDPRVLQYWPDCGEACVNAEVGALFNTFMNTSQLKDTNNVSVYKCANSECLESLLGQPKVDIDTANSPFCTNPSGKCIDLDGDGECDEVCDQLQVYADPEFDPASFYRVVVMGGLQSLSNVSLTGLNYSTTAVQTICGNGVLEQAEECEAVCQNASGELTLPGQGSTDCSLEYNPYCSSSCKLIGFNICDGTNNTNCCGNGEIDTKENGIAVEQCEGNCTKEVQLDFVTNIGTGAITDCAAVVAAFDGDSDACNPQAKPANNCQDYLNNNQEIAAGLACSCDTPSSCGESEQYCSFFCQENPSQKCTEDSFDCTCISPKVCAENTDQKCSADVSACTCIPSRACENDINQACTGSAECGGSACLEVGVYQFDPTLSCFEDSEDEALGTCVKQNICQEDLGNPGADIRSCTENISACSCTPLAETDAECAAEDLTCLEVCSAPVKDTCALGDEGCSCNFEDGCTACVNDNLTPDEEKLIYDSFSWVFRTRDNGEVCAVDSVDVSPARKIEVKTLQQTEYFSSPHGAPDECSVQGQRLNPFNYDWAWSEPGGKAIISTSSVVDTNLPANQKLIHILTSTYARDKVGGCTDGCINGGSASYGAVCGNSQIEVGEDCDDANTNSGDGCSDRCLYEGSDPSFGGGPGCGNSVTEVDLESGLAEECDDGDNDSGDGCSSRCLNEGSLASGFTCGNGTVDFGEDNDFGSVALNSQFGLDNKCLHVGSTYSLDQGFSICGNQIKESGEECESTSCVNPAGESCSFGDPDCVCGFANDLICNNDCTYKGAPSCGAFKAYKVCEENPSQTCSASLVTCSCQDADGTAIIGASEGVIGTCTENPEISCIESYNPCTCVNPTDNFQACESSSQQCTCDTAEGQTSGICRESLGSGNEVACVTSTVAGSCVSVPQSNECCGNGKTESYGGVFTEECEAECQLPDGSECFLGEADCSCSMPDYCTNSCLNKGSSFNSLSFCGNAEKEPGEDAICEVPGTVLTSGQIGSPLSLVQVLGYLPEGETSDVADVTAEVTDVEQTASGFGQLTYNYTGLGGPPPPGCEVNNPPVLASVSPDPEEAVCLNNRFDFTFDRLVTSASDGGALTNANVDFEMLHDGPCPDALVGDFNYNFEIGNNSVEEFEFDGQTYTFRSGNINEFIQQLQGPFGFGTMIIKGQIIELSIDNEEGDSTGSTSLTNNSVLEFDGLYFAFTKFAFGPVATIQVSNTPIELFKPKFFIDSRLIGPDSMFGRFVDAVVDGVHTAWGMIFNSATAALDWCPVPAFSVNHFNLQDDEGNLTKTQIGVTYTDSLSTPIPLPKNTELRIRLINLANKCDLSIPATDYINFETSDNFCHFDGVGVKPAYHFANEVEEKWDVIHEAKSGSSTIIPLTGIYSWNWEDWITNDDEIVIIDTNADQNKPSTAYSGQKNGITQVVATATIDTDYIFGESDGAQPRFVAGHGIVETFICENPWAWSDELNDESYNVRLRYCRDRGAINDTTDDLPLLTDVAVNASFNTPADPSVESLNCNDGQDNDGNGKVDCSDAVACVNAPNCQQILECPEGANIVGIAGGKGWFVDHLKLICSDSTTSETAGTSSGSPYDATCPLGDSVTALQYNMSDYNPAAGARRYVSKFSMVCSGGTVLPVMDSAWGNVVYEPLQTLSCTGPISQLQVSAGEYMNAFQSVSCDPNSPIDLSEPTAVFDETDTLADYFFLREKDLENPGTHDFSPDAIGLRVYANKTHLSAGEWYEQNVPNKTGSIKALEVSCDYDPLLEIESCYEGIQDGNTLYISGGNVVDVDPNPEVDNTILFTNVYVIALSQAANSNSTDIFSQFVANIRLNVNLLFDDEDAYQMVKRDVKRLNDVSSMHRSLLEYYSANTTFPALASGTFVRGSSFSTWPSWQSILANTLGSALPTDPINTFHKYPASDKAVCNDASCQCTSACSDGIDNDGDGLFDSGEDPGCATPFDNSETDESELELLLACNPGDQCFVDKSGLRCSVCAAGSDPSTCYNSDSLQVGYDDQDFDQSYIYGYTYNVSDEVELHYDLEGVNNGSYSVENEPSIIITP